MQAMVTFNTDECLTVKDEGFYYAQKLVPELDMVRQDGISRVSMKIGLPRSLKLDSLKIGELKRFFADDAPLSAYEEIKRRNTNLNRIAGERDEEIRRNKEIDEKKTEFISIASHEIKTPITVLKAYTQMAKMVKEPIS